MKINQEEETPAEWEESWEGHDAALVRPAQLILKQLLTVHISTVIWFDVPPLLLAESYYSPAP